MAKLCSSYSLCPLIEQRNFLGVSEDSVAGCVIVTLGKNIVIRYKLSDQKQVSSWSSRDKLSAPVVYDSIGKRYIGVFKGDHVAFWQDNFVELNKVKKYKFVLLIHSVLTAPGIEPVVVFRNGQVATLSVDSRKDDHGDYVIPLSQEVEEARIVKIAGVHYVYMFVRSSENEGCWLHLVPADPDVGEKSVVRLERGDGTSLVAHTLLDFQLAHLVTFWSDGKMFSAELPLEGGEKALPGRFVSFLREISPSLPAAMVPVSPVHVAVYGADANSEGAMLVIFNVKFGVVQTSSHMKLYSNPPRLWRSGQSQLVLVIGQYLAVAPYRLATPRLATLVGAHARPSSLPVVPAVTWDDDVHHDDLQEDQDDEERNPGEEGPPTLPQLIQDMRRRGLTERAMCEEVMPGLLAGKDLEGVGAVLERVSDAGEGWVLAAARLCTEALPESRPLLRSLLASHSLLLDSSTLALARAHLDLPLALALLAELALLLHDSPHPRTLEWATLLLDSHYQQYLLSRDRDVVAVLTNVKTAVDRHLEYMKSLQVLDAHVLQLENGKCFVRKPSASNKSYVVEKIRLY